MAENATVKPSFLIRYRYWIMVLSLFIFLPPLSFLFQFTGDSNFCGKWCPRMFFVWREGMSAHAYFSGYARSYMGVLLVCSVLVSTFFLGRYWCSHLCPIGGAMELGSRLTPRFLKIDYTIIPAPAFRYGYLTVYFLAAALGIGSLCCSYCNFAVLPRLFGAAFSSADMTYFLRSAGLIILGLVVFLGFFARGGRAYCNLICPIGAIDALSAKSGARFGKRVNIATDKCDRCGKCAAVCPTWAIDIKDTAIIDQLSCIPCRICETECPEEAITYSRLSKPDKSCHKTRYDEKTAN